jgi:hypothetical protein
MRLLCPHCHVLSDREQYVITASGAKAYDGGALYKAVHKRCKKVMYLAASMVKTAGLTRV